MAQMKPSSVRVRAPSALLALVVATPFEPFVALACSGYHMRLNVGECHHHTSNVYRCH
jgi:hypothetical protein